MKLSKLRECEDVLKALTLRASMKPTDIMRRTSLNQNTVQEALDFLMKQGMVKTRVVGKQKTVYSITYRGELLLKNLRKIERQSKLQLLLQ